MSDGSEIFFEEDEEDDELLVKFTFDFGGGIVNF